MTESEKDRISNSDIEIAPTTTTLYHIHSNPSGYRSFGRSFFVHPES